MAGDAMRRKNRDRILKRTMKTTPSTAMVEFRGTSYRQDSDQRDVSHDEQGHRLGLLFPSIGVEE